MILDILPDILFLVFGKFEDSVVGRKMPRMKNGNPESQNTAKNANFQEFIFNTNLEYIFLLKVCS